MIPKLQNDKSMKNEKVSHNKISRTLEDEDVVNRSKPYVRASNEDSVNFYKLDCLLKTA